MTNTELLECLFCTQVNMHIAHLQTSSYAAHKALEKVYENLPALIDRIAEGLQAKDGIIRGYKALELMDNIDPVMYLKEKAEYISACKYAYPQFVQQTLDEIIELFTSTIYKLRFLN